MIFHQVSLDQFLNVLVTAGYLSIAGWLTVNLIQNWRPREDLGAICLTVLLWGCALHHSLPWIGTHPGINPPNWQVGIDLVCLLPILGFLKYRNQTGILTASSEVLNLKKKLEERNIELEQTINQQTQELGAQNQRLNQILTELQQMQMNVIQLEKMSLLGQMIAGITHEINNPINFISGNLPHIESYFHELLKTVEQYRNHCDQSFLESQTQSPDNELDFIVEDFPRVLNSLKLGTDRIHGVLLNLEHFYPLDAAGMKPTNLHEGIESTLVLLNNRYKKKIEVVREFGDIPLVDCYINQLNQVFLNLISNAIEVLLAKDPHSPKRIAIATRRTGNDRVNVMISDNGSGIPVEVQEHLFEPFYTTKPSGVGTGLGLSISHQIVTEIHQGRIYCCSSPDEGTTFIIELPIHQHSSQLGMS